MRFKIKFKVCSIRHPNVCIAVFGWIDTNVSVSILPKSMLKRLGVIPEKEVNVKISSAGVFIKRHVGRVLIKINIDGEEFSKEAIVLFGEDIDEPILGITVLEELGLKANMRERKIEKGCYHVYTNIL